MTPSKPERPIADSYWVEPGRFLAGEYPGSRTEANARHKVRRLLEAGVSLFLDLTTDADGLEPYVPILEQEATTQGRGVVHRRMSIVDGGTPTHDEMVRILDTIDAALQGGQTVYVHCWGGIGRTGTVVGCYLVRHGLSGELAVREIARLRQGTPDGARRAPETDAQEAMILGWPSGG